MGAANLRLRETLAAARRRRGLDDPIIRGGASHVSEKIMRQGLGRWAKRKGSGIISTDKIGKRGAKATAVATRFLLKDLMGCVRKYNLTGEEKKVIEALILNRPQFIPKTNIPLRPHPTILFVKLVNRIGLEKTHEILMRLTKRACNIRKLYFRKRDKTKENSDVIPNIASHMGTMLGLFKIDYQMTEQTTLLEKLGDLFEKRKLDLHTIETSNLLEGEKKRIAEELRTQMKEIMMEKTKFIMENGLPLEYI